MLVRDPAGDLIGFDVHPEVLGVCEEEGPELESDDELELEADSDIWALPWAADEAEDKDEDEDEEEVEVLREEHEPDDDDGHEDDDGGDRDDVDSQSDSALMVPDCDSHASDPEWKACRRPGGGVRWKVRREGRNGVGRGRGSRGPGSRGGKPRISGRPVGRPLKRFGRNDRRGAAVERRQKTMSLVPELFTTTAEQVCMNVGAVWQVILTYMAGHAAARDEGQS